MPLRRTWDKLLTDQVRQNGRLFHDVALRILRDRQAAEDVCQQALAKAWERRDELHDDRRLQSWITRVVVNESLQLLRRRARERRSLEQIHAVAAPSPPGRDMELRETVLAGLAKLPELTRTVVVLRIMQGLSGNEVKQMLDCSASEVSRRLHHGMEKLRDMLKP